MNKHNHSECEHDLAFCKICKVPYCKLCGKEWPEKEYVWTYTYPYITPYTTGTNYEPKYLYYTTPNTTDGNFTSGYAETRPIHSHTE